MKQMLLDSGWFMFHSCTCGGSYKEKYKHPKKPGLQIHIRPNQNKWFYLMSNKVFDQGISNNLQNKLNSI